MKKNMADEGSRADEASSSSSLGLNEWITFEEIKIQEFQPFPEPPLVSNSLNSEHYLFTLGKS